MSAPSAEVVRRPDGRWCTEAVSAEDRRPLVIADSPEDIAAITATWPDGELQRRAAP